MGIDSGERMERYWSQVAPEIPIFSQAEIRLGPEFVKNKNDLENLIKLGKVFRDELNALLMVQESFTNNRKLISD